MCNMYYCLMPHQKKKILLFPGSVQGSSNLLWYQLISPHLLYSSLIYFLSYLEKYNWNVFVFILAILSNILFAFWTKLGYFINTRTPPARENRISGDQKSINFAISGLFSIGSSSLNEIKNIYYSSRETAIGQNLKVPQLFLFDYF